MQKAIVLSLLLFTPTLLAMSLPLLGGGSSSKEGKDGDLSLPLVGGGGSSSKEGKDGGLSLPVVGGGSKGGSSLPVVGGGSSSKGGKSDCKIVGGLLDGDLKIVFQILGLDANLNGVLGDVISLIRCVLEKIIQILQKLLPKLNTTQLEKLTKLLADPKMTKSEILETIDGWIAGEPIELREFYNQTVTDVETDAEATLSTLIDIANGISPELGNLVKELSKVILNDVITLLHENELIGKLVSNLLGDVDKLADDLLKNLDNLLCGLLNDLGLDGLLDLTGLKLLDGLIKKGGLLGLVADLLNSILNGGNDGLLGGVLGGVLGGEKGLVGGILPL